MKLKPFFQIFLFKRSLGSTFNQFLLFDQQQVSHPHLILHHLCNFSSEECCFGCNLSLLGSQHTDQEQWKLSDNWSWQSLRMWKFVWARSICTLLLSQLLQFRLNWELKWISQHSLELFESKNPLWSVQFSFHRVQFLVLWSWVSSTIQQVWFHLWTEGVLN